jgi:hypothetical protein
MQYILNDPRRYITTVEFRNLTPIVNVERLLSFTEEGKVGNFIKKEFEYSFDNVSWQPWQNLTNSNLKSIDFQDYANFFIHIKYTRGNVQSGNIDAIILTYDANSVSLSSPLNGSINADFLNGEDGAFYLNNENHFGSFTSLAVSNVADGSSIGVYSHRIDVLGGNPGTTLFFKRISASDGIIISESSTGIISLSLDPTLTAGVLNVGDGSANVFVGYDLSSNILLRTISGIGAAVVSQVGDQILISIDASFSGDVNLGDNVGIGQGIYSSIRFGDNALLFKSLSSPNKTISITSDSSNVYIDVSSNLFATNASLGIYATNASVNLALRPYATNASIGIFKTIYIDPSLVSRDISINALFAQNKIQDVSIQTLYTNNYVKVASLGYGLAYNTSTNYFDVSIDGGIPDASYNSLFDMIIQNSTNIGGVIYDSSIFITSGNDHQTSISNLDTILGLLAPAKPNTLTGKTLLLTNSGLFSAKLPSGLSTAWYYDVFAPGSIVNDYAVDNTFRLTTPSFADTFSAGFLSDTNTRGTLYSFINDASANSYNMNLGFGNVPFITVQASGILRFNNEAGYGGINADFWRRAEAYIDVTTQQAGAVKYKIGHSESLISNNFFLRYDPSPGAAKWSVSPTLSEGALNTIFLSGIEYYGINSEILVSFIGASGIFRNAYHPVAVGKITSAYGSQVLLNPPSIPSFSGTFNVSNASFVFDIPNITTGATNPTLVTTLYKPNFTGDSSILTVSKRLNTYSPTRATTSIEYFTDESKRLLSATAGVLGVDTPWDSMDYTIFNPGNGPYAQVQNGTLRYPVSADYAGFAFSGTNKEYIRRFTKTGALSNGILTFAGFNPLTDSSSYGTGNTNIIMWLTDQDIYFDLALEFGTGGDGSTPALAKGAWTARSNSSIAWSLGTISLGNETTHTNTFALIVTFRNTIESITQITLT